MNTADQLQLPFAQQAITGQAALPMLPADTRRRLLDRGLVRSGVPFYLLYSALGGLHVWSGRGQMPAWVRQCQHDGQSLDGLKAVL